jgi:hypothetical protein
MYILRLTLYVHAYISLTGQQENMAEVAEGQGELFLESSLLDEPATCRRWISAPHLPFWDAGDHSIEPVRCAWARDKSCTCAHVISHCCFLYLLSAASRRKEQDVGAGYLDHAGYRHARAI